MITTIKTAKLVNKKQAEEQIKKIKTLEGDLILANEKLAEQDKILLMEKEKADALEAELKLARETISEKDKSLLETVVNSTPEKLIMEVINEDGKVDESFLRYALKVKELADEFVIGKIHLRKVYLGGGKYYCKILS